MSIFGALNLKKERFYWKKSDKGNGQSLKRFFIQMEQNYPGKDLFFILDNSSIHKSALIKKFLVRHPRVRLFFLPPYSPQYNPIERFWGWLKTKVYGLRSVCSLKDILQRIRKLIWHYNEKWLENPIQMRLNVYRKIL